MKNLITILAVITAGFVLTPMDVDARPGHGHSRSVSSVYVSGYTSCGCPIYTKKIFSHYNRYGRAVYTYHRQSVKHSCHRYSRHRGYGHHAPISYHHGRHGRSGVSLHTPFGRVKIKR